MEAAFEFIQAIIIIPAYVAIFVLLSLSFSRLILELRKNPNILHNCRCRESPPLANGGQEENAASFAAPKMKSGVESSYCTYDR